MASSSPSGIARKFEAVFTSGKPQYTVTVTEAGSITWVKQSGKEGSKNEESRETVPQEEILAVSPVSKGDGNEIVGVKLSFIKHKKKNILHQAHMSFTGAGTDCQQLVNTVQELINTAPLRPRKMLVLVNPVSGNSKGVKIYETKVAPLFRLCGVTTNIIVTERAHQTEEIMTAYDLASIDSIVVVGGDGIYHEVANGLLLRTQKEAGIDINDPDAPLKELTIPIGLIPAGTGNGIMESCTGTQDIETAVLTIIRGKRRGNNIFSVFSEGKFQIFAALLVGNGFWADVIYTAENKRHLGKMRYPVAILDHLFITRARVMDMTVEYLKPISSGELSPNQTGIVDKKDDEQRPPVDQASDSPSRPQLVWQKERLQSIGFLAFISDIIGAVAGTTTTLDIGGVVVYQACTKWQLIKSTGQFMTMNKHMLEARYVEHHSLHGLRMKLNSPSAADTDNGRKELILNIDGEIFPLKRPEVDIRLHVGAVQLFYSVEGIWWHGKKSD